MSYIPNQPHKEISRVLRRFGVFAALLMAGVAASAAPSGGPYGPRGLTYQVPADAKRVFYVAPDGDAKSEGRTLEAPTTIETAIAAATTGDALILRGGEYRTGSLVFNQGITIQPYLNERPVLKGTRPITGWEQLDSGLWRAKWDRLFPSAPADWWRSERHGPTIPSHWFNNDMVFFDGRELLSAGWQGEVGPDTFYIDYERGFVYLSLDPNGHSVEITAHDGGLTRTIGEVHGRKSDKIGPKIRGITMTQYAYRALEVEGRDPDGPADPSTFGKDVVGTLLEDVTITYCSRVAAYLRGDRTVVRHCLISDTETEGLYLMSSSDCLLERNIIKRNNVRGMLGYFPSAVKIFNQTHRVVARDNLVTECPNSDGIWYDVGNIDGLMVDNWIEDAFDGLFFEISKGVVIEGNLTVNCDSGIRILNSSDATIRGNVLVNTQILIERTPRSAEADHFGWHPATGPDVDERVGHQIVNNMIVAGPERTRPLIRVDQTPVLCGKLTDSQVERMDGNVYVRRMGTGPLVYWSPLPGDECGKMFDTLEAFNEATGFEDDGKAIVNYPGQVFQSEELKRFDLLPGFPAEAAK